jgi:hypothetical protein
MTQWNQKLVSSLVTMKDLMTLLCIFIKKDTLLYKFLGSTNQKNVKFYVIGLAKCENINWVCPSLTLQIKR